MNHPIERNVMHKLANLGSSKHDKQSVILRNGVSLFAKTKTLYLAIDEETRMLAFGC